MIELRDISKVYKETDSPVKAVGNVNLSIDTGCFVSIVGRSGSGKSTLANEYRTSDDYAVVDYDMVFLDPPQGTVELTSIKLVPSLVIEMVL